MKKFKIGDIVKINWIDGTEPTKPMAYDALLYAGRPLHLTLKKEWY